MVDMKSICKAIALRDIDVVYREKFSRLKEDSQVDAINQIIKGYTNPYLVADIVFCRAICLEELRQEVS